MIHVLAMQVALVPVGHVVDLENTFETKQASCPDPKLLYFA
jgi:hypothetical protein